MANLAKIEVTEFLEVTRNSERTLSSPLAFRIPPLRRQLLALLVGAAWHINHQVESFAWHYRSKSVWGYFPSHDLSQLELRLRS